MMDWQRLLNVKRLGKNQLEHPNFERTPFLKDYDRVVYSSAFRRLKDKTQVFPLSQNADVRTRLIHSLEVSCVGRSLGRRIGETIIARHGLQNIQGADFGDLLSVACLAHDIGNPPFGHAGEDAMQTAFASWRQTLGGESQQLSSLELADLERFEGNAQGFRFLTRLEMPHRPGGLQLTCATLATFMKYPRQSFLSAPVLGDYQGKSVQKYGFFAAEKELFAEVAQSVGLLRRSTSDAWWCRHPLTFLMEAADDICYSIVDLEDGFHMGYVPFQEAQDLLGAIGAIRAGDLTDSPHEIIKRLRAKAISELVSEVAQIFLDWEPAILRGDFDHSLLQYSCFSEVLAAIEAKTAQAVFHHPHVVSIKVAGYEVLGGLLMDFLTAIFTDSKKSKLTRYMLPATLVDNNELTAYAQILRVTDHIAGMTDRQAALLFQQLRGITF
jgi:dGTPase